MKQISRLLALPASLAVFTASALAGEPLREITAPPAALDAPAFYKKYIAASGYPIVASGTVNDYALREAAYLTDMMLAKSDSAKPTTRRWRKPFGKANTPRGTTANTSPRACSRGSTTTARTTTTTTTTTSTPAPS